MSSNLRNMLYLSKYHWIMEVNDEIRDLIAENGTTEELERAARNSGMRTLRENGINYVLNGTTSVEEMLKASYE